MITEIAGYVRKIMFRLRWFIWSDRERYAYLWSRTQRRLGRSC
ncbi:hypothetical protein ACFLTJ_02170 [Chloroflexota bacterium]